MPLPGSQSRNSQSHIFWRSGGARPPRGGSFRLERRYEVEALLDPGRERCLRPEAFRVDKYEAGQGPAGEFHRPDVRPSQRPLTSFRADPNHQSAARDAAAHAAADDEGEASDHPLLDHVPLARKAPPDSFRDLQVVAHGLIGPYPPGGRGRSASG